MKCPNCGHEFTRTTKAEVDPVLKLYYEVVKFYGLAVRNHNHIKAKAKAMIGEVGEANACTYLQSLLDADLREIPGDFRPTLTSDLDVYAKRIKIMTFLAANAGAVEKVYVPPTPEEEAKQEAERKARAAEWAEVDKRAAEAAKESPANEESAIESKAKEEGMW